MARPNRGERFSNDSARAVYAAFESLPEALRWELYWAVQQMLAVPDGHNDTQRVKEARAVGALHEALDLNEGQSPSVDRYRALRDEHPERTWPDDGSLRRWLGAKTWNDALERAHLPVVADGDALIIQLGPAFSRDEARTAVRDCARDYGYVPSWSEYLSWAKRPDVKTRNGRRPVSQGPFERLYGSDWWTKARIDARVLEGEGVAAGADGRIRTGSYFATDKQIGKDLREVARRLGRSPRTGEYTAERHTIFVETTAAGRAHALVSYATIQKRYRTWDNALVAHGLEPLGGRHTGAKPGPKEGPNGRGIPDDVICAAIREGYDVLGDPYTQPAYSAWREDEIDRDTHRRRELPSYHTIWKRYGTWDQACNVALGAEDPQSSEAAA